jgi:hypothetical protein
MWRFCYHCHTTLFSSIHEVYIRPLASCSSFSHEELQPKPQLLEFSTICRNFISINRHEAYINDNLTYKLASRPIKLQNSSTYCRKFSQKIVVSKELKGERQTSKPPQSWKCQRLRWSSVVWRHFPITPYLSCCLKSRTSPTLKDRLRNHLQVSLQ